VGFGPDEKGYLRPVLTRGFGNLGINPAKCIAPTVYVICSTITLYPAERYDTGIELSVARRYRHAGRTIQDPNVKSNNYLNNINGLLESRGNGTLETLMLTAEGNVAEATADNLFLVRSGEVVTPAPEAGMLIGVTRNAVIEVTRAAGYVLREELFRLGDVLAADECFLTGTGAEIAPVREVDGQPIGTGKPGPITHELHAAFQELTAREGTPVEAAVR